MLIEQVNVHPDYNFRNFDNDIAILTLNESVAFSESIAPICLPSLDIAGSKTVAEGKFTGFQPFVAGWGATNFRGPTSSLLRQAQLSVMKTLPVSHFLGERIFVHI